MSEEQPQNDATEERAAGLPWSPSADETEPSADVVTEPVADVVTEPGADVVTEPVAEAAPSLPGVEAAPVPPAGAPRVSKRGILAVFLAAILGAGIGTGATWFGLDRTAGTTGVVRVSPPVTGVNNTSSLSGVAAVARAVVPSIVQIQTTGNTGGFFNQQVEGTGSGVIYRADGYIVTNNHVIEGAESIKVTFSDGRTADGTLVGTAWPTDDVAVIKVNRTGLAAATFGSSSALNVGDLAVAIGSPFGLQGTVTAGVISALHRNIDLGRGEQLTDALQTDAPINPGNSGGALVSAKGEVIGLNTAIVGATGGNVGVGFAIPIDTVRRDADQIISTGRAQQRPYLGILGQTVGDRGGALVTQVVTGGPAQSAGLRAGDIIIQVNDSKVGSMDDLIAALGRLSIGDTVRITYTRDGRQATTTAKLAQRPSTG